MCRSKSKTVATILEDVNEDGLYLNTIENNSTDTAWNVEISVQGVSTTFKLDTGAEVTAISPSSLAEIGALPLKEPSRTLHGPDRKPLKVMGSLMLCLAHKDRVSHQEVYVVDKLKVNLLGLPAIKALNVLSQVNEVNQQTPADTVKGKAPPASIKGKFPKLFQGLGSLKGEYKIRLREDATPCALSTARHVPLPLKAKVEKELARMVELGVITKVDEPTEWCSGMVVVPKKNGEVRICVDLKPLNEAVLREVHPLPDVDDNLAQLSGATVFSKLDANSGFWQIPLEKSSRLLTTFITPFGRFCFNKLPFGISSAPEYFQKRMSSMLEGLDGFISQIDDVLIFGKDQDEHDRRLHAALSRIQESGLTLNESKCQFSVSRITFLGHVIDKDGISPDPQRTKAIREMQTPTTVKELRRFLGMVNQLGKFSANITEIGTPLRKLLSTKNVWTWGPAQQSAFDKIKQELSSHTVLALYDPLAITKISADASSYGLGAVLLQKSDGMWRPVSYASRSMSETEGRYAQIEKEALATTWACEKFSTYILGKHIELETDHKPLVPLLNNKHLDSLPPRILRFRLRLMRFAYTMSHVPGKSLYTADTLSRAPLPSMHTPAEAQREDAVEFFIEEVISNLPGNRDAINKYRDSQATDPVVSKVMKYCRLGWPRNHPLPEIRPFYQVRAELSVCKDLLLFRNRIVVPASL
jgi:hypothetical protein